MATEDRNLIKDLILSSYVKWSGDANGGLPGARKAYKKVIHNMYPTFAFYKSCLQVENTLGKSDKDGQANVEFLFEMASRMDNYKEGNVEKGEPRCRLTFFSLYRHLPFLLVLSPIPEKVRQSQHCVLEGHKGGV
jgi:hypothetical protein